MKFFADTVTTFKGPLREQRAAELVDALPSGAAEHLGDGVVKMRRNVVATGWCLEAEAPRPRRPITPFAALIIFACSFLGAAACVVAGEGAAPISGGFWAPLPLLEQTLPDPREFGSIGWFLVILFIVIGFAGMIPAAINGWRSLFKTEKKAEPTALQQPIVTKREERMARWDELQALRLEFETFRGEIRDDFDDLKSAGEARAERLTAEIHNASSEVMKASNSSASKAHARIDAVAEKQGQLMGTVAQINENVRLLLARLGGSKS